MSAAIDLATATATQPNALVPGAVLTPIPSEDPQRAPAIKVAAANHQGVALDVTGGPFPAGTQVALSVWMKGESAGQVVHAYFGYHPAGDWGANPNIALSTSWAKYDLTWTPSAARATAGLAVRSETAVAIAFDLDVALPAAPPPPPPPPPDQTLAGLATLAGSGGLIYVGADGRFAAVAHGEPGQVLGWDSDGIPKARSLGAPPLQLTPPPAPPPPASGGRSYSNAKLFAATSWWRTPVPATPPQYPDATKAEAWLKNLCGQVKVDRNATGPFGVPVPTGAVVKDPWFNVQANNFMVYVIEQGDEMPVRVGNRYVLGNPPTGPGFGPWLMDSHNKLMQGVPVPPGAHADDLAGDHAIVILLVDANGVVKTLWDLISFRPIGDAAVAASIKADGKPYEGTPQGYFNGKKLAYTVSGGSRMDNVDQHNGAFKDIIGPDGVYLERKEEGAAATSVPYAGGLITPEEAHAIVAGTADDFGHTLKCHLANAWSQPVSPAQRTDGTMDETWVPEGSRWYLSAGPTPADTAPMTDFSPYAGERLIVQAFLKTLARFGIMGTDKTGFNTSGGFDGPLWRNPSSYPGFVGDGTHAPYGAEFYPAFFGPAGSWGPPTAILQRIPWQNMKCLHPSASPA